MKQIFIFLLLLSFIACKKEQVATQPPSTPIVTTDPYVGTWHESFPQPNDGSPMQMTITKVTNGYHINLSTGCGDTLPLTISSDKTLSIPNGNRCGCTIQGGGAIVHDTLWLNWTNSCGSHSFSDKYIKL